MTLNLINTSDYISATNHFLQIARLVTPENIDNAASDGWSARQVIHHMADSELQSATRLRRLIAEPSGSTIQGYDESAWAESEALGYRTFPIEVALTLIEAVRTSSAQVLAKLPESALSLEGIHTESGKYTLQNWLDIYTRHPIEHADQLTRALQFQS